MVQFPVRAHAWVVGQVPIWGHTRDNSQMYLTDVSLPLLFPPLPSFSKATFQMFGEFFNKLHYFIIIQTSWHPTDTDSDILGSTLSWRNQKEKKKTCHFATWPLVLELLQIPSWGSNLAFAGLFHLVFLPLFKT